MIFYYRTNNHPSTFSKVTDFDNSSTGPNENISAKPRNQTSRYKMHSLDELPENDYRRGIGYQPVRLNDDQRAVFEQRFNLVRRKGVYPYEYFDTFQKFSETSLPPKSAFYSQLKNSPISDDDYKHAENTFSTFEMDSLGSFHDYYISLDILLLADLLSAFRNMSLSYYRIDPAHCFTTPGLSWQAALRMTGVELELIDNPDIHQLIEAGVRGGVSVISRRKAEAGEGYKLAYWDSNNLYGLSMCQYLPTGNFHLLTEQSECDNFDYSKISEEAPQGFIFKLDVEYPDELHEEHNEYPLAPEKLSVTSDMLSDYQKLTYTKLYNQRHGTDLSFDDIPSPASHEKLVPNLLSKKNYIVHGLNLKYYMSKGLVVKKIHAILQFDQRPWLKPYIEFNTQKRALAENDLEKDLFKLMNNAVFGKTLQNPRKQRTIDFVSSPYRAKKLVANPLFKGFQIINENLYSIERAPTSIMFDKPIYAGFTILELSKLHMFQFHYDHIKKLYPGDKSRLCFTDTDSFLYSIKTDNVYADMMQNKELFDFSNFPDTHPCFEGMQPAAVKELKNMNKKVLGKFKDELGGEEMLEFIGLRSKVYSFRCIDMLIKNMKLIYNICSIILFNIRALQTMFAFTD